MAKKNDNYKMTVVAACLIFVGAAVISVALGQIFNDAAVAALGIGTTILVLGMMYHAVANR